MTVHYVADGDRACVFEGSDARLRAIRYASQQVQGEYGGPLNLRWIASRWLTKRGWRNSYQRMWRNR